MKNNAIAIVGMAGRFPGSRNITEFWRILRDGMEMIRQFSDAELRAAGVSEDELAQPEYVKSGVVLQDLDMFDAAFFGFSPRDAAIMDPQHRIFLECAWEALEDAGHVPESFKGSIGVYAGSGMNSYMIYNLLTNQALVESAGLFLIRQTGNDKDVLATRVSYELNLHGPSINVQTACSTSLVATHLACQSLLNQECDMALAGGVTIEFPHGHGYEYREGEILSRDGHCRAFDADASGTVFSSGTGVVVLRRLEDALADHDTIHAVILGSAINNDGSRKVGYLAPSVDGQAEVIAEALGVAGVKASEISYVETHGTGTRVGDPIEVKALTQAFRESSQAKGYCAIGSLKTNIGHLDTAAGVASLIKTVLALRHRQIPPSLHFRKANPLIDFQGSPFFVNDHLTEWKADQGLRRAGVTSLGIGGTNAHVVLEEAPAVEERTIIKKPFQLLVLSAKTAPALEQASRNLATYLQEHRDLELQDVAYTCQSGRKPFAHRRALAVATNEEASALLSKNDSSRVLTGQAAAAAPGAVFMFSGQGSQYVNMGRELYETETVFRSQLDLCAERLISDLGFDLRTLLFPPEQESIAAGEKLSRTCFTQPALFGIEYALAQWWIAHGVRPAAMIGHSIGEYVAACLGGVFSLEDALHLCAVRGRLMGEMPGGSMLAVSAIAQTLKLPKGLTIAAINGPESCVVSGPTEAIQKFAEDLEKQQVPCRLLHTSHAFHSAMMDPVLEDFRTHLTKVQLHAPQIPYISNLTGTWIAAAEATSPDYWTAHLRNTVRFSDGLAELFRDPTRVFLEVGPGQTLTSLTRQHSGKPKTAKVLPSTRHPQEKTPDALFLLNTVGQLWIMGHPINWNGFYMGGAVQRIPLPTYPFDRQRFWIEPGAKPLGGGKEVAATKPERDAREQWFHRRVWKQVPVEKTRRLDPACWLVFLDGIGLGTEISKRLKAADHEVLQVSPGDRYQQTGTSSYVVRPGSRDDYDQLLTEILKRGHRPARILHLWSVIEASTNRSLDQTLDLNFYSLLSLAQALGDQDFAPAEITCVSNGLQSVSREAVVEPARATLLGPIKVIPKEFPGTLCRSIDVDWNIQDPGRVAGDIIAELSLPVTDSCVSYRRSVRWVESFEPTTLRWQKSNSRLKEKGVYLITGGMGGIGLVLAEHLARTVHARLVLVGRARLSDMSEWEALLKKNGQGSDAQKVRKLREIQALGGEVLTVCADVTDRFQMEETIRIARQRFGDLDGVVHAAGLIEDGPLQIKTRDSAARVLAPKIQGTLALHEALAGHKLDFVVLFSSISSLLPPAGQVDYAAANAFLDAFALSQTGHPMTAINWGLWADVGMGTRGAAGNHPILGRRLVQTPNEIVYSGQFSQQKNWLLAEHRFKNGNALVPGTAYLQLATAALTNDRFESGVAFEDVFFLAPLSVAPDETKEVRVRLRRDRSNFRFSILAKDKEWIEHASGQIARNKNQLPANQDVTAIRNRCSAVRIDFDDQHRTRQEQFFDFGPRWRNLRTLSIGQREAVAELQLGREYSADLEIWMVHPALLDLATGAALYLIEGYQESTAVYLPMSYKRIKLYRPLPSKFWSHIRCRQENTARGEVATFDITLLDEDGKVLSDIEEFAMRRMANTTDSPATTLRSQPAETYGEPAESTVNQGIASDDGMKAFDQILSSEITPGIIVVRGEFATKPTKAPAAAPPARSTATAESGVESVLTEWWKELLGIEQVGLDDDFFDLGGHSLLAVRLFSKIKKGFRLDLGLSTLFEARTIRQFAAVIRKTAAPSNEEAKTPAATVPVKNQAPPSPVHSEIEATLSEWWRELLGVEQVGLDDDFFDLGGHSLLAVRLFSKIKKAYRLDLGLSSLFEARTIRQFAAVIRKAGIQSTAESGTSSAVVAIREQGSRWPLYLVSEPGDNEFDGHALAQYLGEDQPVFAIQPQELDKEKPQLARVEDMAAYCLGEIRSVQPHGPYCLVGFSVGGWVAFEMAQQLRGAGEAVGLLGLVDTFVGDYLEKMMQSMSLLERAKEFFASGVFGKLYRLFPIFGRPLPQRVGTLKDIHRFAALKYKPTVYSGSLVIFRSITQSALNGHDELLGWGGLAAGMEVEGIPGTHRDLTREPNVQVLAKKLRACLDRAQDLVSHNSLPRT
jgi:acyl transferase domain-containing protein/thioesterase domain-containing protein